MILVSSCLLGNPVRYDGKTKAFALLEKYKGHPGIMPICPECAGKLAIPRPPAEIQKGTGADVWLERAAVKDKAGKNVTENFKNGALAYAELFRENNITAVILKERSPSCGVRHIYDGTFTGTAIDGQGVAAAFFQQFNVPLYSEEDLTEELLLQLLQQDNSR